MPKTIIFPPVGEDRGDPSDDCFTDPDPYSPSSSLPDPIEDDVHEAYQAPMEEEEKFFALTHEQAERLVRHKRPDSMGGCPHARNKCKLCGVCCKVAEANTGWNGFHHNRRCARCNLAHYCSKKCQRLDWRFHKPECTKPTTSSSSSSSTSSSSSSSDSPSSSSSSSSSSKSFSSSPSSKRKLSSSWR